MSKRKQRLAQSAGEDLREWVTRFDKQLTRQEARLASLRGRLKELTTLHSQLESSTELEQQMETLTQVVAILEQTASLLDQNELSHPETVELLRLLGLLWRRITRGGPARP
jgi:ABC-type transporter Mla subunit MlaD